MPQGKLVQATEELRQSIEKLDFGSFKVKKKKYKFHKTLSDRFWDKVKRGGDNECWIWTSVFRAYPKKSRNFGRYFYGLIKVDGRMVASHRVSFFLHHGRWPANGMVVMHSCDNTKCVNPLHLVEGTQKDNARDASRKGRLLSGDRNPMRRPEMLAKRYGDRNPAAKLTSAQTEQIRNLRATRGLSQDALAKMFNVSQSLVSMILSGKIRSK